MPESIDKKTVMSFYVEERATSSMQDAGHCRIQLSPQILKYLVFREYLSFFSAVRSCVLNLL